MITAVLFLIICIVWSIFHPLGVTDILQIGIAFILFKLASIKNSLDSINEVLNDLRRKNRQNNSTK